MTADTFVISEADSVPRPEGFQLAGGVTLTEERSDAAASPSKKAVGGRGELLSSRFTHDAVVFPPVLSSSFSTLQ